jgi:hypothetical protein
MDHLIFQPVLRGWDVGAVDIATAHASEYVLSMFR